MKRTSKPKYSKRYCLAKNCGCLYDPSAPNQKYCNAHKSTKLVAANSDTDAEILLRLALSDAVTKQQQRVLVKLVAEYLAGESCADM